MFGNVIKMSYLCNMKTITLSEDKINEIIKQTVMQILEGIDVDVNKLTVDFNPNHQNYINTNDPWKPKPIYNTIDGYNVISIFEREISEDGYDGNPLIYALKNHKWKFKNPHYDIMALLRRFVAVTKELNQTFDVIITTPSSNQLNNEILYKVERIIPHSNSFENFFMKYSVTEVYESFLDNDWLEKHYADERNRLKVHRMIYNAISQMNKPKTKGGNNGIFSYKFIKPTIPRNAILQTMSISPEYETDEFKLADRINGKKILIIDDTVTTGKTLSDSAKAIMEMYDPKSITFLTLFSPLKKNY